MSFFAFPTPRLQILGNGDGADVAHGQPDALNLSPYHDWTFDVTANADFIADVRTP